MQWPPEPRVSITRIIFPAAAPSVVPINYLTNHRFKSNDGTGATRDERWRDLSEMAIMNDQTDGHGNAALCSLRACLSPYLKIRVVIKLKHN